jgi:hypothetical protein
MNEIFLLRRWAENAVSRIVFPGDKRKVYEELMAHMEDHRDALMEQGMSERQACEAVEKAMGDPWTVARELAEIHRPFWGYFLRATRIIMVLLLIATLFPLDSFLQERLFRNPHFRGWDVYDTQSYGGDTNRTLLHMSDHDSSFETDGYTYTVTKAVVFHEEEYDRTTFQCRIKEFNPRPWATHAETGRWFWAEDSNGNYYYSDYETAQDEEPRKQAIYAYVTAEGLLTNTYEFWINNFPVAEWVKLHYTRDGRDEMLFINLTGGGAK